MDIFKKTAICIFVSASLIACGGGGGDSSSTSGTTTGTTYKIESGAFQKGPFVAGTTVTIQELGDDLKPTGVIYTTVTDDTGRFNADNIKSRFVEVFADGFYFDELTNLKSKAAVTLRAILDLTASASKPSINTLTTMQTERLRAVKANGKTFQEAEVDSRNAVLGVFGLPANAVARLDSINLTGTSAGDESLLRATVALLQVASNQSTSVEAELTQLVAKLASDLKDDGLANGAAKDFVFPLQAAQSKVNMDLMRLQLQEYLQGKVNTLTTADEVAKAAAAFIAVQAAFGRSLSLAGGAMYKSNIPTDGTSVSVACNQLLSAPTYTAKTIKTADTSITTLTYPTDCPHGDYVTRSGGKIVSMFNYLPPDLDHSKTEAVNFTEGLPASGFYPTINGTMEHTFQNNLNNDVYKGSVKLDKQGLVTVFSFPDGLFSAIAFGTAEHGATYTTATGKMSVTGGNALNCISDGVFGYQAINPLVSKQGGGLASGSLEIRKGAVEAGTVIFNADGSINVRTPTESQKTISKSVFASYCGVGDVLDWEKKRYTN